MKHTFNIYVDTGLGLFLILFFRHPKFGCSTSFNIIGDSRYFDYIQHDIVYFYVKYLKLMFFITYGIDIFHWYSSCSLISLVTGAVIQ